MSGLLRIAVTPCVAFQSAFCCGAAVAEMVSPTMEMLLPAVRVFCLPASPEVTSLFVAYTERSGLLRISETPLVAFQSAFCCGAAEAAIVTWEALSVMEMLAPATSGLEDGLCLMKSTALLSVCVQSACCCGAAVALMTLFVIVMLLPAVSLSCLSARSEATSVFVA